MTRFEELTSKLNVDEAIKPIIYSLLKDFVFLETQIEELRKYPRYVIDNNNPRRQQKLPVHDLIKDYQAQKNDIATKILRTLGNETSEESPLIKALAHFKTKGE